MDPIALAFVKAALLYLCAGAALGLAMALWPATAVYYFLPSHTHLNLLGWVSMAIFGVAYHVFPRFSARPLHSRSQAWAHFLLSNIGLIGMALFFALDRWQEGRWRHALAISGGLQAAGLALFVLNMWKTLPPVFAAPPPLRPGKPGENPGGKIPRIPGPE